MYNNFSGKFSHEDENDKRDQSDRIAKYVTKLIHELGIPANVSGYRYIRTAVVLTLKNDLNILSVTKELYPAVAAVYDTTPPRVERAIRHAIEVAWTKGNLEKANELFGYSVSPTTGRPTNSEFIATIADYIRMEIDL